MNKRKIILHRNDWIKQPTINKTIIDYATEYTTDRKPLYDTNAIRRHKGAYNKPT